MKKLVRAQAIALSVSILLTGCGGSVVETSVETEELSTHSETVAETESFESIETNLETESDEETEDINESVENESKIELSQQQKNSFSMLYYLAITAEDIRISKDNRLMLDDIYSSLLNDINPGAIDETTQDHLRNLRDIIKAYMSISVKRDRLQFIYNQQKAESIRSAVPNPLAILSVTNALDWKKLAVSTVFTVVDSYNNYKSASAAADQEFLMSGWELDDEETETIQSNRERAFDYMVDIVQEYDLDGNLTLNEHAIENFAEICKIESVQERIHRLEADEETYALLGNYWLELADAYFETSQYDKCLQCIEKYKDIQAGIYRKDFDYVQILPKAIVAAQNVYTGQDYISNIESMVNDIMANTTTDDWSIRYFAAQTFMDLYSKTQRQEFLKQAYDIAYDNVTILLNEQREINKVYLSEVQDLEAEEPDYRFMSKDEMSEAKQEYKAEKKRVKEYNKSLKAKRKTECLSLYEPLVLNCDLLYGLADELNISDQEKQEIETILQTDTNGIFLIKPVNDHYRFNKPENNYDINFAIKKIIIPANLLTDQSKITITIKDQGQTTVCDDCVVFNMVRNGESINDFAAYVSSDKLKKYKWSKDSKIELNIDYGIGVKPLSFKYKVSEYKDYPFISDKVVFERQ